MAQVCGLASKVRGRLALFCIHRVNRVYGTLVWTCYELTASYKFSYHHYYYLGLVLRKQLLLIAAELILTR